MKTTVQKKRSFIIAVICLIAMVSGCAAPRETAAPANVPTTRPADAGKGYSLPLTTTGETLSICGPLDRADTSEDPLPAILAKVTEETGVKIEWEVIKSDFYPTMQARLAAGAKLPDIINVPAGNMDVHRYIDAGLFQAIDEAIFDYAPNIEQMFSLRPDLLKMTTYADGKLYILPNNIQGWEAGKNSNDFVNPVALLYREDLLEKTGLKVPETIDEIYTVLSAFKQLDPKYIPLSFPAGMYGSWNGPAFFSGSFGLHLMYNRFYPDDNDVIKFEMITPEFKEYTETMSRWYIEEIIDNGTAGGDAAKVQSQILNGITTMVVTNLGNIAGAYAGLEEGWLNLLPYPKGPGGKNVYLGLPAYNGMTAITKDCQNLKLALQYLDYAYFSEISRIRYVFGIEGESYEMVDGMPRYKEDWISQFVDTTPWAALYAMNAFTSTMPATLMREYRKIQYEYTFRGNEHLFDLALKYADIIVPQLPAFILSGDEASLYTRRYPDIDTYVNEMYIKFIMGTEPFTNFDAYVNTVNSMGIDEVIGVIQNAYDRYNK